MEINTRFYDEKLEELKMYHRYIADRIRKVRPWGERGIRVTLDDGAMYDFVSAEHGLRRVASWSSEQLEKITEEDCRSDFANKLIDLMAARGYNQSSLAERTGLSTGTINKYLHKRATPSLYALQRIAYALECSIDELTY